MGCRNPSIGGVLFRFSLKSVFSSTMCITPSYETLFCSRYASKARISASQEEREREALGTSCSIN